MKHIFFHFLRQQSTAASGNSSFFKWTLLFSQSFIQASGNKFFLSTGNGIVLFRVFSVLFYSEFFSGFYSETVIENWGKSVLKNEIYSCWWTPVFSIFWEIIRFFKVEATFPYSRNAFFNKSFIRLAETDYLFSGNSVFWSELFFC